MSRDEGHSEELGLLERLRRGDEAVFEQLVRQYSSRLLAVARRLLGGNEHDAQDVVQEAFLSAFKAIREFTGAAKLSTWLHRARQALRTLLERSLVGREERTA